MQENRNHRNYVYSREDVANMLRRCGLPELADKALRDLPDSVDIDQIEALGLRHGVTKDELISWMGGSP
jgi:hypothetical protein